MILTNVPELNKKIKHDISILVDRIVLNSNLGNRLAESVETSLNLANGLFLLNMKMKHLPKKLEKLKN